MRIFIMLIVLPILAASVSSCNSRSTDKNPLARHILAYSGSVSQSWNPCLTWEVNAFQYWWIVQYFSVEFWVLFVCFTFMFLMPCRVFWMSKLKYDLMTTTVLFVPSSLFKQVVWIQIGVPSEFPRKRWRCSVYFVLSLEDFKLHI